MSTAEWHQLGDRYHRKTHIYDMLWNDIDLDKFVVAAAPFGGPIAMVRDERKVLLLGSNEFDGLKPRMLIFTSAGKLISSFQWDYKGLVAMGWSNTESLICVLDDGNVSRYTIHGEPMSGFDLGPFVRENGVAECHMWSNGLVVRTANNIKLIAIHDFNEPRPQQLPDPVAAGLDRPPTSMTVIPPQFNNSGGAEVLLATAKDGGGGSIIVVDQKDAIDMGLDTGPFSKMVISPNGTCVACFNDAGDLFVMSTDFSRNLSKFETKSKKPPRDLVWCGNQSTILYWDKMLLLIGQHGDYVKYAYRSPVVMVSECDGVRVITDKECEFLQEVPKSIEDIFKIGSITPAALLYDAAEAFDHKNVKADENIRRIKDNRELAKAIDACLDAAAHEFDSKVKFRMQRSLLKAAAYGKLHCSDYNADHFVDMCKDIRVLNAIRHYEIGAPLTYEQYIKLTAEVLVDRLINRHNHLLALRICKYLNIKLERVLVHWACAKIKTYRRSESGTPGHVLDQKLGQLIVQKLDACPGISFAKIATTAFHAGRRQLATMLLGYEPLATDQVPLLISMKEDELALTKAIESGDTDLVYLAILHIKKTRDYGDFFKMIRDKPLAKNLYIKYCRQQGGKELKDLKTFYYHLQQPHEAANITVIEAYLQENWVDRIQSLNVALEFYQKDRKDPFSTHAVEEQIKLLQHQRQCEKDSHRLSGVGDMGKSVIDVSVTQLIEQYILQGDIRNALKVQKKFKVPEKRMWHIQVRTLAESRCWKELNSLIQGKRVPPIGFQPFVEACVEQKEPVEAVKYINRLPDPGEKMEWLCNIGYWKEAADIAVNEKDLDALHLIKDNCKSAPAAKQINNMIKAFGL